MEALQVTWFVLVGVLLTGYAILDGFDLGVGFWHLFARKDEERRAFLKSIGPFWDGNEVWLLTGGGALFAAFPPVYASVFSGFYLALILLLGALIFRAVSIEFRNHLDSDSWRRVWDRAFSLGSSLAALLFGVALGNVMRGIPLNTAGDYTGTFFGLLNPYALLIGLTGFAMLITHGAAYLAFRIEGDIAGRALGWARVSWLLFAALTLTATGATFATQPHLTAGFSTLPVLWIVPLLALASVVATGIFIFKRRALKAFLGSSATIFCLMLLVGASLFPNLVPAMNDPALSLTVYNSSSSEYALTAMLIITIIGLPLVLGYTFWVYRTFGGKVVLGKGEGY